MPTLEQLSRQLVEEFKTVRLRALQDTPTAFGSTYAKESGLSHSDWVKRVDTWNGGRAVCYIAMDEGQPCGIIAGYFDKNDPRRVEVASMWVAPTQRRAGLGTTLMEAVERWAHNFGAAELRLMVTSNNATAKRFYQRCGFTFTGKIEPYRNDPALLEYEMLKYPGNPTQPAAIAPAFDELERNAIYRVIRARRDVRRGFVPKPLPDALLTRLLTAAHDAPSVGLMQPSRFIVIRSFEVRRRVHAVFQEANRQALAGYQGALHDQYADLKLEGILEAPQNLCIVCDAQSEQGHGLGRQSMPQTAIYSTVCAVQNLWLAARAEGVGVGWVSILSPDALCSVLNIPGHIVPVAYLCLGYVDNFGNEPELERLGWERRSSLESVVFEETYTPGVKP